MPAELCLFIFSLSVGDRVPADVRLVKVNELSVDESSFTGEPVAQLKQVATVTGHGHEKLHISDMTNVAFQGMNSLLSFLEALRLNKQLNRLLFISVCFKHHVLLSCVY